MCNETVYQTCGGMKFKYTTIRDRKKTLVKAIAKEELPLPSSSSMSSSITTKNTESQTDMENPSNCYAISTLKNVKNILQTHFFEKVLKEGADINKVWSLVDERKLPGGLSDLIREYQRSKQNHQNKSLCQIDDTVTITMHLIVT